MNNFNSTNKKDLSSGKNQNLSNSPNKMRYTN